MADDIFALFAPYLIAAEELGHSTADMVKLREENSGLKERLDFVTDPARKTAAQHTIEAMAGERDQLRKENAALKARVGCLESSETECCSRLLARIRQVGTLRAQLADAEARVSRLGDLGASLLEQLADAERVIEALRDALEKALTSEDPTEWEEAAHGALDLIPAKEPREFEHRKERADGQ